MDMCRIGATFLPYLLYLLGTCIMKSDCTVHISDMVLINRTSLPIGYFQCGKRQCRLYNFYCAGTEERENRCEYCSEHLCEGKYFEPQCFIYCQFLKGEC